jgi:hypothetical protein
LRLILYRSIGFGDDGASQAKKPMSGPCTQPGNGSVAMMILFEEGKWRLEDPVTKYLPELKELKVWKGEDENGKPILEQVKRPPTMRELMSHTAGFGYGLSDAHPAD